MRPPRLRLRTLMIAVSAIALILGAAAWTERHRRWVRDALRISLKHQYAAMIEGRVEVVSGRKSPGSPAGNERARRRVAYHNAMAEKYSQAALRPWMPIWPDPPEPK